MTKLKPKKERASTKLVEGYDPNAIKAEKETTPGGQTATRAAKTNSKQKQTYQKKKKPESRDTAAPAKLAHRNCAYILICMMGYRRIGRGDVGPDHY